MSGGYSPKNVTGVVTPISGIVTNQVVTVPGGFPITNGGSLHLVVKITTTGVTQVGTITAKLQTGIDGAFVDSKTATITASGDVYIKLMAEVTGDQAFLPLLAAGQVVITTTNAGDVITVSKVSVLQEI